MLVCLPDGQWIALTVEAFHAALAEGVKLTATPAPSQSATDEPLIDADQLSAVLSVPVSWIEQKAREGKIPSHQFGRWRRFRRSEVESAVRALREH
jgi:excisionase family DNA binding protein